jgi:hypothetical protein
MQTVVVVMTVVMAQADVRPVAKVSSPCGYVPCGCYHQAECQYDSGEEPESLGILLLHLRFPQCQRG